MYKYVFLSLVNVHVRIQYKMPPQLQSCIYKASILRPNNGLRSNKLAKKMSLHHYHHHQKNCNSAFLGIRYLPAATMGSPEEGTYA